MSAALYWRSLCGPYDPRLLTKGTELSVALFGPQSRFAAYEIRTTERVGNEVEHDREYIVRDAAAVSDDDLRAGKRPPIVGRTDSYDKLLAFVAKQDAGALA